MITQAIETITPDMAKEYLETNKGNRTLQRERVFAYAEDMARGAWRLNGESIKFDTAGRLLDGQHRLAAVVKANVPVEIAVTRNVDANDAVFDIGKPRSQLDIMRINNVTGLRASISVIGAYKLIYRIMYTYRTVPQWFCSDCDAAFGGTMEVLCAMAKKKGTGRLKIANRAPVLLAGLYSVSNGAPIEKMGEFLETLNTGFYSTPKERAAIVLRNDIIGLPGATTAIQETLLYATERAISDYLRGYERVKSYMSTAEPVWPLASIFQECNK